MANYILGDVMVAEAFVAENGQLKPYFTANTLTDSTMNISVTAEEIRGGSGNKLLGKIFHDTNFGVNLTDAMWSLEYMAAQIGSEIKEGQGANLLKSYNTKIKEITDGSTVGIEFDTAPDTEIGEMFANATGFCADASGAKIVWFKDCNGKVYTANVGGSKTDGYTFSLVGAKGALQVGDSVCVSYPEVHADCRQLIISAAYAPKEFSLFLTGKLFEGNSCKKSDGKYVAKLVIEIPRFQLDGTVDLAMNPSSAATVSLNGNALAYGCTCGEDEMVEYAKLSIVKKDSETGAAKAASIYKNYNKIVVADAENIKVGVPMIIYMAGDKATPTLYNGTISVKDGATDVKLADDGRTLNPTPAFTTAKTLTVTATEAGFGETKPTYTITVPKVGG